MEFKIIGLGAAGNKAAIDVVKEGVLPKESILLINSTLKDVPEDYRDFAVKIGTLDGCGKERKLSENMMQSAIENSEFTDMLEEFIPEGDITVLIVGGTEGGTASGSMEILRRAIDTALDTKTILCPITGFQDDIRGIQNTLEFFEQLGEDGEHRPPVVLMINNKDFLSEAKGNKQIAEELANKELARKVSVLKSDDLIDSKQVLDNTDKTKVITEPGMLLVGRLDVEKISDEDEFDVMVEKLIDNNYSFKHNQSAKKIAVMLSLEEKNLNNVDYDFTQFKKELGDAYEIYRHIQTSNKQFIAYMASGLDIPLEEIQKTYNEFKEKMESLKRKRVGFGDLGLNTRAAQNTDNMDSLGTSVSNAPGFKKRRGFGAKGNVTSASGGRIDMKRTSKINQEITNAKDIKDMKDNEGF